jgi:hypothetical protein
VVPDIKVAGQGDEQLKLDPPFGSGEWESSDSRLMIKAALAHFDSLNAKK